MSLIHRIALLCLTLLPVTATAQGVSILQASLFGGGAPLLPGAQPMQAAARPLISSGQPLFDAHPADPEDSAGKSVASLFIGRTGPSLLAPYPARTRRAPVTPPAAGPEGIGPRRAATQAGQVLDLIAQAEAGRAGYDAVQYGARIRPVKRPTQMTLQEIQDWISATPGQPHAIGRYQFIPATLKRLVAIIGAQPTDRFGPALQDRLADQLLAEAGLAQFQAGELPRHAFMTNLAKIWAGLPTSTGKSYYHGYAGNRATMTWAHFDDRMARIFAG
ncbi:hypothetical protein [Aliiroseovarius sp.]|uniref:hypothetical protein n=1 Tax=Aliiroseovarius sp. TaxID=1872442 RepID=UPI00261162AD|nr:hypothetical protein [Aliiroseovarius sp.]